MIVLRFLVIIIRMESDRLSNAGSKFVRTLSLVLFVLVIIVVGVVIAGPHPHKADASGPTTWYIRPDGGTRYDTNQPTGQCDGQANAPYPGTGVDQHCAFNDFRWLYDDQSYNEQAQGSAAWVISGGDTVIIDGCASGLNNTAPDCRIGFDSNNDKEANGNYAWCFGGGGSFGCYNPPIPAGTPTDPTRILGVNYQNCSQGNLTDQSKLTQLFGGFGAGAVLNLTGTQNVQVECLDITDHSNCVWHGNPAYPVGCDSSIPSSDAGDYAGSGIITNASTANILFQDVHIHGLIGSGIQGPIGAGISMNRVNISFNGFAGWNFDDGNNDPDGANASINANYVTMEGNGCDEEYPIVDTAFPAESCYDLSSEGFGDSWSGQDGTLTSFTCNHCIMAYNTKDGFIGPHTLTTHLTITNSASYGNMGQQWKWGAPPGATTIFENNLTIGNCNRMSAPLPGAPSNYNQYLTLFCRAAGDMFSFYSNTNSSVLFANDTTVGYSETMFDLNCGTTGGCASTPYVFRNNIMLGLLSTVNFPGSSGQTPGLFYLSDPSDSVTTDHDVYYNLRGTCPLLSGTGTNCADPLLVNEPGTINSESQLDNFNFALSGGSPAIGAGVSVSGLNTDYDGSGYANPPSVGALESGSTMSAPLPAGLELANASVVNGVGTTNVNSGGTGSGGGSSGGGTTTPPSTPPATNNPTGPSGYTFCANENGTCSFAGTMSVAFGAGSSWHYLTLTNGTPCTNAIFTDPDVGVVKACFTKSITPTSTPDTTPPTTSITSPANNASVSGTISVSANASDNVGVTSVALYVDGSPYATDPSTPYTFSINTNNLSNGAHTFYTKASDAAGNVGTSGNVTVTVANSVVTTPPPVTPPVTTGGGGTSGGGTTSGGGGNTGGGGGGGTVESGGGGSGGGGTVVTTPSLIITGVSVNATAQTSAKITITTNLAASVVIKYGRTTAYNTATVASPLLTTNYENLPSLSPGTVYDFTVIAAPISGSVVTSPVYTFITAAQIAPSSTPSAVVVPAFTQNIAYDDSGAEVTLLQNILHAQGFLPASIPATGYFGVTTEHALLLFQAAHDLNKSGFVDQQSQALLNKIAVAQGMTTTSVATPTTPAVPAASTTGGSLTRNLAPGSTGADVTALQHLLANNGDYSASIFTAYYGSLTEAAVKIFQTKNNIINYGSPTTTGYGAVGPKTRARLNEL